MFPSNNTHVKLSPIIQDHRHAAAFWMLFMGYLLLFEAVGTSHIKKYLTCMVHILHTVQIKIVSHVNI